MPNVFNIACIQASVEVIDDPTQKENVIARNIERGLNIAESAVIREEAKVIVFPEAWFQGEVGAYGLDEAEIQRLIKARAAARASKDFAAADRVRDTLIDMGVMLEDGVGGTTWKRA